MRGFSLTQLRRTVHQRRWLRYTVMASVALLLFVSVALWMVTRSWFIIAQIKPELEAKLGGQVSIGRAAYAGGGWFHFHDIALRSPEHTGMVGEVLVAKHTGVRVNVARLLRASIEIEQVRTEGVVLRLAEDERDPGRFTFMSLDPQWQPTAKSHIERLPRVDIPDAIIEYGTYGDYGFVLQGQRRLSGAMQPKLDTDRPLKDSRLYAFHLLEVSETGETLPEGIVVAGTWDVETNEHAAQISGLALDQASFDMMPQQVRGWWDHMEFEGRLADARIEWRMGEPLSVIFSVENVGLTMPIGVDNLWARYQGGQVVAYDPRPRMRVTSGSIRLAADAVELNNLVGELEASSDDPDVAGVRIPWEVTLHVHGLPAIDWEDERFGVEHALNTAPFHMAFTMSEFRIVPDEHGELPPVDLPLDIAQMMERFLLANFAMTARVEVGRDADGRVDTSGRVSIREASGSFYQFPYQLTGIEADLTFDAERVRVESLQGRSPGGALVNITGEISPPGRHAGVDLRLTAQHVAVDEHLRAAMRFRNLDFFDVLMNVEREQSLRDAGRLQDDAPFELGGRLDLDLHITRPHGPNLETDITGTVAIRELGVIFEHFPYPFTVTGGMLAIEPDGVWVIESSGPGGRTRGLPIETIGGGVGYVTGGIGRERTADGQWRAFPELRLRVEADALNDLMLAAIPLDEEHTALLQSANFSGVLDYKGRVFAHPSGKVGHDFTLHVRGEARPGERLAELIERAGLIWRTDRTIRQVEATLHVADARIELVSFQGLHDFGVISAAGGIDFLGEETVMHFDLDLRDLQLGRHLIDLIPQEDAEAITRFWDRYEPSGWFDARLALRVQGDRAEPPLLLIDPSRARVVIENELIEFKRHSGDLSISRGVVSFDDLVLELLRPDRPEAGRSDGVVTLTGSYWLHGDGDDLAVTGRWESGRFDSPIVIEAIQLIGAHKHIEDYRRFNPRGVFNADFRYFSGGAAPAEYMLAIQPRTVLLDINGASLAVELHRESRIVFDDDDLIVLHDISGVFGGAPDDADAAIFALSGEIHTGEHVFLHFEDIAFDGRLMDEQVQGLLPKVVSDVLRKVEFADGPRTMLQSGSLVLVPADDRRWHTSFEGVLLTTGASFRAGGVAFEEFDGGFTLSVDTGEVQRHDDGRMKVSPRLELDVRGERLLAMGRRLTDLHAPGITIIDDEGRLSLNVPEVRAGCYDGVLWAQANVGLSEGAAYEARIEIVGAEAGGLMSGEDRAVSARAETSRKRQGRAYGGLRIAGLIGKPESRTGRGMIRAVGGNIEAMPIVLSIVRLLQLTLPLTGSFDNASAEFFIDGDIAYFERILLESTFIELVNMQLHGEGQMNLSTYELRTQFRSRGGMLVIRDLVGGVGDTLFAIEITGTLRDPKARLMPLPGLTPTSARSPSVQREPDVAQVQE